MKATRVLLPFVFLFFSFGIAGPPVALSADLARPNRTPSHAKAPDLGQPKPGEPNPGQIVRLVQGYGRMPLSFEANQGQTDGRVRFLARGSGYTVFLTDDEAVLTLLKSQPGQVGPPEMTRLDRFGRLGRLGPFSPLDARSGRWPSLADNLESLWHTLIPDLSQLVPEPNTGKGAGAAGVESQSPQVVRMRLVDGNTNARVVGLDQLPGRSNYFIGNDPKKWRTNVPNYAKVKYEDVYPGVDLVYYGDSLKGGRLEYDFVVAPGADPNQIKLSFAGADGMRVDAASGDLVLKLGDDEVRFRKPAVYQPAVAAVDDLRTRGPNVRALECGGLTPPCLPELAAGTSGGTDAGHNESIGHGRRQQAAALQGGLRPQVSKLDGSFELESNNEVSFRMVGYDPTRALVIDPVLSYSTFLGGSSGGGGFGIAVDAAGNAYVTGYASSVGFPVVNPPPGACGGSCNAPAFVAKLNPSGSALVYSTYLGGSLGDLGWGIAVDAAGDAYVTGYTASMDFPTVNPLQANCGSCRNSTFFGPNAFVAELNPTGSALIYSTYLGGSGADYGRGIAVDAAGSVYVAGVTSSYDFPTANPLQRTCSYCDAAHFVGDAFVAKLNPAGSALVYSTYLGGSKLPPGPGPMAAHNQASGIAADAGGNAYVTGFTEAQDFPTANPLPGSSCGGAFVAKLNPAGSSLVYSTCVGAGAGNSIAVDVEGDAYVTGSASSNFPTVNPLPGSSCGGVFVTELNPVGGALVYSTCLGGSGVDQGNGLAVDVAGNAFVTGWTVSTNFPTANPIQPNCDGCGSQSPDAFVFKLNSTGSALVYSTFLGGSGDDRGYGIAVDPVGNTYVTGKTGSSDFPTANPLQPGYGGGNYDAFVAEIAPTLVSLSPISLTFGPQNVGSTSALQTVTVTNTGTVSFTVSTLTMGGTNATDFATSADACTGATIASNGTCTVSVAFAPSATGNRSASLSFTDNTSSSPQTVSLTGTSTAPVAGVSSLSVPFGNQNLGTASGSQPVTLSNTGSGALTITSIATTTNFGETDNCAGSVAASGSCTINVTFSPTATGPLTGALTITDNSNGVASSTQTVSLSGTGTAPLVSLSTPGLSFGSQPMSTTSGAQTVTVTNAGTGNLNISTVTMGGTNASDFAKSADTCTGATITPNSTCTVSVTFTPSATGSRSASLSFANNASNSQQTVTLSGTGTAPVVSLSAPSLSFGSQLMSTASAVQSETVTNTGTANLTISTVMMGGTNASDFAKSADTCTGATVTPNGTCTLSVTFTPSATGSRSASLNFTDNASNSPQAVPLSGTGTAPLVSLSVPGLAFGSQPVSTTSGAQAMTVTNAGAGNLIISTVTMGGANASDFAKSTDTCTAATVIPNGTCTVSLTFTPSATGSRSASLNFTDNASNSLQTVTLSGTGTAPVVSLAAPGLSFGNQLINTTSTAQAETVTNTGTANLTMSTVTMDGANASDFAKSADTCTGATIAPNGTCTVSVTFTPSASGSRSASLSFTDNASNSPQAVSLSGTAILGPMLTVSPTSMTFSAQYVGTTGLPQNVTLQNTGDQNVTISNVQASSSFGETNGCTSSLAPQVSCTIGVFFDPTASGNINGTLTITDNAPGSPHTVALSGAGQDFNFAPASGSSTSAAVAAGQAATYTLSMAGKGGLNQKVTFTCTGAPSEATCTVPSSVTAGSSATNVLVTVSTTAASVTTPRSRPLPPVPPLSPGLRGLLMLALVLATIAWAIRRRSQLAVSRWRSTMVLLASGLLLALALAGCGGGGSGGGPPPNPGTPAGTYTLTVTGSTGTGSATLSHSVALTLTVS